ncbi:MAG: hypothetical protein GC154_08790 [bacterium]|nr:hypothetical protein [bacterium]
MSSRRVVFAVKIVVALALLASLFALMIPHFLHSQYNARRIEMQSFAEAVIGRFSGDEPKNANAEKIRGARTVGFQGPMFGPDRKIKLRVYFKEDFVAVNESAKELFFQTFPEIEPPEWDVSPWCMLVTRSYGLNDPEYAGAREVFNSPGRFTKLPVVTAVKVVVGATETQLFDSPYFLEVDAQGYYNARPTFTPYNPTNGLASYGEFYADSSSILPRQKAVIMDPPPDGQIETMDDLR